MSELAPMENFILFVGQSLLHPIEKCSQALQRLTGYNNFAQARMLVVVFRVLTMTLIAFSLFVSDLVMGIMLLILYQSLGWSFRAEIDLTETFCTPCSRNRRKDGVIQNLYRTVSFIFSLYMLTASIAGNASWGFTVLFGVMTLIYFLLDSDPLPSQQSWVRAWTDKLLRRK